MCMLFWLKTIYCDFLIQTFKKQGAYMHVITNKIITALRSFVRIFRTFLIKTMAVIFAKQLVLDNFSKVLIVAPHPDDEVLGCGGLISTLVSRGKEIKIIFLTFGENSHSSCCNVSSDYVASKRQSSAYKACDHLGISSSNIFFVNFTDGSIPRNINDLYGNAVDNLCSMISEYDPSHIFCPHPLDIMPDHISSSELINSIIYKIKSNSTIYYYCTWFWIYAPMKIFLKLNWNNSFYNDNSFFLGKKMLAMETYLDYEDLAPCGAPWPSKLPNELLKTTSFKNELFFKDIKPEIFASCWTHYSHYI